MCNFLNSDPGTWDLLNGSNCDDINAYCVQGAAPSIFHGLAYLNFTGTSREGTALSPLLTDKEAKAQRGEVTGPRSHSC